MPLNIGHGLEMLKKEIIGLDWALRGWGVEYTVSCGTGPGGKTVGKCSIQVSFPAPAGTCTDTSSATATNIVYIKIYQCGCSNLITSATTTGTATAEFYLDMYDVGCYTVHLTVELGLPRTWFKSRCRFKVGITRCHHLILHDVLLRLNIGSPFLPLLSIPMYVY